MASTALRMNLCSPIMTDTSFTIPADSRLVTRRNWRLCGNSSEKGLEKGDCETDYMQYGLYFRVFMISTADGIFEVLRPHGQPPTRAGSQKFQGHFVTFYPTMTVTRLRSERSCGAAD